MEQYTVGELAEITGLSSQTIRYYDRIGLLKPLRIDERNGYRLYGPMHILYLNSIRRLALLGCSLREIKAYLSECDVSDAQDILSMRLAITEEKIRELHCVRDTLKIRMENVAYATIVCGATEISVKSLPMRKMVYLSAGDRADKGIVIRQVSRLLLQLEDNAMLHASPVVCQQTGVKPTCEVGFFYNGDLKEGDYVKKVLPQGQYAYTFHKGPYENMLETFEMLYSYLEKEKLKPLSDIYQLFVIDYTFAKSEEELLTEIQILVENV